MIILVEKAYDETPLTVQEKMEFCRLVKEKVLLPIEKSGIEERLRKHRHYRYMIVDASKLPDFIIEKYTRYSVIIDDSVLTLQQKRELCHQKQELF